MDVILSFGHPANQAAKEATTAIPIVVISADPVAFGLVDSFARPGGNVTGLSMLGAELSAKRIEMLKKAAPHVSRVAYLLNPANPASATVLTETEAAARSLGLELYMVQVASAGDLHATFSALATGYADAVMVQHDPMLQNAGRQIADLAAASRLVAMGDNRQFVEHGGLMSYGPSFLERFRRAAAFVDRLFSGAKPTALPIEQPTTFDLVLNLRTAQALGLTIPQSVLLQATEVIQ